MIENGSLNLTVRRESFSAILFSSPEIDASKADYAHVVLKTHSPHVDRLEITIGRKTIGSKTVSVSSDFVTYDFDLKQNAYWIGKSKVTLKLFTKKGTFPIGDQF